MSQIGTSTLIIHVVIFPNSILIDLYWIPQMIHCLPRCCCPSLLTLSLVTVRYPRRRFSTSDSKFLQYTDFLLLEYLYWIPQTSFFYPFLVPDKNHTGIPWGALFYPRQIFLKTKLPTVDILSDPLLLRLLYFLFQTPWRLFIFGTFRCDV